jgi:hypothetical protein
MLKNKKYIYFLFPCEEQDKGFIFCGRKMIKYAIMIFSRGTLAIMHTKYTFT